MAHGGHAGVSTHTLLKGGHTLCTRLTDSLAQIADDRPRRKAPRAVIRSGLGRHGEHALALAHDRQPPCGAERRIGLSGIGVSGVGLSGIGLSSKRAGSA